MADKMFVSTRSKRSGTSYRLPSVHEYGNEFLQLVRDNRAKNGEADHHASDTCVRTSAQIESTLYSFLDFTRREDSNQPSLKLDPQRVGKESEFNDEKASQLGERSETQVYTSSQQGEASSSLTQFNGGLDMKTHTQFQDTETNPNTEKRVNFSVFSRIRGEGKCADRCSRAARPNSNLAVSRFEEITAENDYEKRLPAEQNRKLTDQSTGDSNSCTLSQIQRESMASKAKEKGKVFDKTCSSGVESDQAKENPCARPKNIVYMATSSVGSLGASNDQTHPNYTNERYHQPRGKRKYLQARDDTGVKRSRHPETHNYSEKKRRDKIRKKMRTLQQLIPSCKKMDKISLLDETIEYLKTLQLQLQIMSMERGLYMPPMNPMLTTTTSVAPQSTQFFTQMTSGMDLTNGSSMFCSPAHFPCLQAGPNSIVGIPGSMFKIFGFPWQMPVSLSIPQASGVVNPSKQSDPVPPVSGAINHLGEQNSSASQMTFRDLNPSDVVDASHQ